MNLFIHQLTKKEILLMNNLSLKLIIYGMNSLQEINIKNLKNNKCN